MHMSKIIAVLGMPGSGKSEAIEYLVKKYEWPKIYFAQPTFDEMERRGLERNQANERLVREDLRNLHGEDFYAQEAAKKVALMSEAPVILLESFYSAPEYRVFRERFGDAFVTIAIHARPSIRHARLAVRPERPLNAMESIERDWAQLTRLTQGTPIALADHLIINEGSLEAMQSALDRVIAEITQG
ncbi:MAG: dephospho-CoA kinase [Candidatus Moraniibacteriota bacterium]|nr:MAG: dephospho-CoA kinase [Candidatus Moranbacteria bacterium]